MYFYVCMSYIFLYCSAEHDELPDSPERDDLLSGGVKDCDVRLSLSHNERVIEGICLEG